MSSNVKPELDTADLKAETENSFFIILSLAVEISKFLSLTGIKKQKIFFKSIHGWRYSYSYHKTSFLSFWNKKISLGVCGDWLSGPKAENAYLSAVDLYEKIKKNPL